MSMRNWPEEDSLHFHMGIFTSFLRKDSKSMYFLSEPLICLNQHPEDRKFHHLLLITCVLEWSLKVRLLILYCGSWQNICWASVRPQKPQTCELYGFCSLSLNGSMAEFLRCFWQVTSLLHFLSEEQNSPVTADTEGYIHYWVLNVRRVLEGKCYFMYKAKLLCCLSVIYIVHIIKMYPIHSVHSVNACLWFVVISEERLRCGSAVAMC